MTHFWIQTQHRIWREPHLSDFAEKNDRRPGQGQPTALLPAAPHHHGKFLLTIGSFFFLLGMFSFYRECLLSIRNFCLAGPT